MKPFISEYRDALFLVSIVALITFFPLFSVGLTTFDELNGTIRYLLAHSGRVPASDFPLYIGRITYFMGALIANVPYWIDNFIYFKTIALSAVLSNYILFGFVLYTYSRSVSLSLFSVLWYMVSMQNTWDHQFILTAHPFAFHIYYDMLMVSLLFYHRYRSGGGERFGLLSALFYILPALGYESFLLYFPVFPALELFYFQKERTGLTGRLFEALRIQKMHILLGILYVVAYLLWSKTHPPIGRVYTGTETGSFKPLSVFHVIYQFGVSSFPLYLLKNNIPVIRETLESAAPLVHISIGYLVTHIRVEWLVAGLLTTYAARGLLAKEDFHLSWKSLFRTVWIGLFLVFVPSVAHGFAVRYQEMVRYGIPTYATTYFSYAGSILIVTVLLKLLYQGVQYPRFRGIVRFVILAVVFLVTYLTAFNNYYIAKSQSQYRTRWILLDRLLETPEFRSIPDGSIVLAPSLWENARHASIPDLYWGRYVLYRTGKHLDVTDEFHECCIGESGNGKRQPIYYIRYAENVKDGNAYILLSRLERGKLQEGRYRPVGNHVVFVSRSKNRNFVLYGVLGANGKNISAMDDGDRRIPVGLSPSKDLFSIHAVDEDRPSPFVVLHVFGEEMDLDSILPSFFSAFDHGFGTSSPRAESQSYRIDMESLIVIGKRESKSIAGSIVNTGTQPLQLRSPGSATIHPYAIQIDQLRLMDIPVKMDRTVLLPGERMRFSFSLKLDTPLFGYFQIKLHLLDERPHDSSESHEADATRLLVIRKDPWDNRD